MPRSSQKNYLARLLEPAAAEDDDEQRGTAGPSPMSGSSLLSRANSLHRIASGELQQAVYVRIDPKRCAIWSGNARDYAALDYERCRDLIDSMIAEGGQKVPALVRKLKNDPDHDYEVIYGTRRHWAISWLRENNYPDFVFLAEVRNLDDEAAFRLADLENRARKDITEIERARNYAAALPLHYGGKQAQMAERLNISKGLLSKMITFAGIDDRILAAFFTPGRLSLRQGYTLAQATTLRSARLRALRAATVIASDNAASVGAGEQPLSTTSVLEKLLAAASGDGAPTAVPRKILYQGKPVVTVLDENRNGVRLQVHSGTGATFETVIKSVREVLRASEFGAEKKE